MTSVENTSSLPKLVEVVDLIRKLDPEMSMQTLLTLLLVGSAGEAGLSQLDLFNRLGMSKAAVSRNVSILSKYKGPGLAGLGLIESEMQPENRRQRVLRLTPKGAKFLERVLQVE